MYKTHRIRPGELYFQLSSRWTAEGIEAPPEIWRCECNTAEPDSPNAGECRSCASRPVFVRVSAGGKECHPSKRFQYAKLRDAAKYMLTCDEYVEARLFSRIEPDACEQVSDSADGSPGERRFVIVGGPDLTFAECCEKAKEQVKEGQIDRFSVSYFCRPDFAYAARTMPGLREVHLTDGDVSCAAIDQLSQIPTLESIYADGCNFAQSWSDALLPAKQDESAPHECRGDQCVSRMLGQLARRTRILFLEDSHLGDDDVKEISRAENLEVLAISGANVSDAGGKTLGSLRQLRSVHLSDTEVGDVAIHSILRNCPLERLYIDHTQVTDRIVPDLLKAPRLKTLAIRGTNLTRAGLEVLRDRWKGSQLSL